MLRVDTVFTGTAGLPGYNSLYFGGQTSGEAVVAEQAAWNAWAAAASSIDASVTITTQPEVFLINPANGQAIGSFPAVGHQGTGSQAGDALPPSSQGLVRVQTNLFVGGRRLRGRIFVPGAVEAQSLDGVPEPLYRTDVGNAFTQLISDAAGAGGWHVYSRTHGVSAQVQNVSVWTQWAVQRSRRP